MTISRRQTVSHGPEETRALAAELLAACRPPAVFALYGELGSGKTCFVQGLALALGVAENVVSPTFTLIREYTDGRLPLCHVDLYRIRGSDDALALGLDDYLAGAGVVAIEWAERAAGLLPPGTVHVEFRSRPARRERLILAGDSPPPAEPPANHRRPASARATDHNV